MISYFTLTRQPENIVGLEVVCIAKAADVRQIPSRCHATIRAGRPRLLSSKSGLRVPRASTEKLSNRGRNLLIARRDFPTGRRAATDRSAAARIAYPLACRR